VPLVALQAEPWGIMLLESDNCWRATSESVDADHDAPSRKRQGCRLIEHHHFREDVLRELPGLRRLDNWHGPMALITDWLVIITTAFFLEHFSGWIWWMLYLVVAVPLIGTRQRALATLLHEAAHRVLARNARWNWFLGTLPSGYLVLWSFRRYQRSHVAEHHGHFGDPRLDPDLRAHIRAGTYDCRTGREFALRFMLAPLLGLRQFSVIRELFTSRLLGGRPRERAEALACVGYVCALFALCFRIGLGPKALTYWLVPLLTSFPLWNWYIEMLEHFPLFATDDVDVRVTRHRAVGSLGRHFIGIHNEGYHLDHHLSPGIPFWNLPKAHRVRLRDPLFASTVAEMAPSGRGVLWQYLDIVRRVDAAAKVAPTQRPLPLLSVNTVESSAPAISRPI